MSALRNYVSSQYVNILHTGIKYATFEGLRGDNKSRLVQGRHHSVVPSRLRFAISLKGTQ